MKNIDSTKVMRWMTWTAVFLLVVVVSNSINGNDSVTISIGEMQAYVLGFVAIEMMLIGVIIASYKRCGSYIVFICFICLVSAAQFHAYLPAVQMYFLTGLGIFALCRWILPKFIEHRDGQHEASVTPIRERRRAS